MVTEKKLRKMALDVLDRTGRTNFKDIEVQVLPADQLDAPITAYINFSNARRISFKLPKNFDSILTYTREKEKIAATNDEMLKDLTEFVVKHEFSHHEICPATAESSDLILKGIIRAIEGKVLSREELLGTSASLSNMFADNMINSVNCHGKDGETFKRGLDLAYLIFINAREMGVEGRVNKWKARCWDKAFTLFVDQNRVLGQTTKEYGPNIEDHYARFFMGLDRYRRKLTNIFTGDEKVSYALMERKPSPGDISALLKNMDRDANWGNMANQYAEIMFRFMNRSGGYGEVKRSQPSQGSGGNSPQEADGNKKKDSGSGKDNNSGGSKKKEEKSGGNSSKIDQKREERMRERRKNNGSGGLSKVVKFFRKMNGEISDWDNYFGILDRMYDGWSRRIPISSEIPGVSSPIDGEIRTSTEEMPLNEFSARGVDWSGTRVLRNPEGDPRVVLYRKTNPVTIPNAGEGQPFMLPNLGFIVDSSISMQFNPFSKIESERGQYHHVALGFYSILNYLKDVNIAHYLQYHMINFSNDTYSSGWTGYDKIEDVKRVMFRYQGMGTALDPQAIADMSRTAPTPSLTFMLSDTELNDSLNETQVLNEISAMRERYGAGFMLFQIGSDSSFAKAIRSFDFPVYNVQDAEDYAKLSLKITKEMYGRILKRDV